MTNQIQLLGTQNFMGKEIPVVSGGFGEDKKVIFAKTVAEIHDMNVGNINQRINENRNRFKDGVDIIDLKTHTSDVSVLELGFTKAQWGNANNIYILSERGYAKLIKIMDNDLAWEIHDQLIDEYFKMREVINSTHSYMINDPIERAKAWIKEQEEKRALELVNKEQEKVIEKQEHKINEQNDSIRNLLDISDLPYDTIRQRIYEFMSPRHSAYNLLYKEFDLRYGVRSASKFHKYKEKYLERYERKEVKKKDMINSQLAYICDEMEMAEELYLVMQDIFHDDFLQFLRSKIDKLTFGEVA